MDKKIRLMVGPTAIPVRVLNAMNREVISHRSPAYTEIQKNVEDGLKKIFQTKNDVLILTNSGSGAMEAAIQNCFSPKDKVVVPIIGHFSERFAKISELYGLDVTRVPFRLGETTDVNRLMERVDKSTKGVLVVHNESSTGVTNDINKIGNALKDLDALLIVDSVSGLGGLEFKMDEWNVDIALTSSQKALMAPPGVALMGVSQKAYTAMESSTFPKFYLDLKKARDINVTHQTPWTPAIYTIFAIEESLKMMFEEGLENIYLRHIENTKLLIDGVKRLGLKLLVEDENYASPTLTAICTEGKSKQIVAGLAKEGIIIAGGVEPLANDIIRVGTMGYVSKYDINAFLIALEVVLNN